MPLPLNGRTFIFLAHSLRCHSDQQDTRGLGASGSFARTVASAQNNYLLDGIDNNVQLVDFLNGTHFVVRHLLTPSRNSRSRPIA